MENKMHDLEYLKAYNCKVVKKSGKPFKSKRKVNTVKGVTINPNSEKLAFTFFEDDSIVDCQQCVIATPEQIEENTKLFSEIEPCTKP